MSRYYRIKNWQTFQHYKDRSPPWIKLHRDLITSRTWVTLDDASRVLAVASMVLAAATDNKIPADPAYVRRVAYLNQDPDFAPLLATEFIEIVDDSGNVLADASNLLAKRTECYSEESRDRDRGEKRREELTYARESAFDEFKSGYPQGLYPAAAWLEGERRFHQLIDQGETTADLLAACQAYRAQCDAKGSTGTQFVRAPAKFFEYNFWRGPFPIPKTKAQAQQDANVEASVAWLEKSHASK